MPIFGQWLAAFTAATAIVKLTAMGPVILVVSEERGWGVHSGDAVALLPLALAGVATWKRTRP